MRCDRVNRPAVVAAINGVGGVFTRAGLLGLPTVDSAIESACRAAKLPHGAACELDLPGDDSEPEPRAWREGLRVLLDSYASDSKLTALGHLIAGGQLTQWLKSRARLVHHVGALTAISRKWRRSSAITRSRCA